jgi:hypothetical protein
LTLGTDIGGAGRRAQAVEHLPSKYKALSQIPVPLKKKKERTDKEAGGWWLMPVIQATWEAEIGRIMVRGQPEQIP